MTSAKQRKRAKRYKPRQQTLRLVEWLRVETGKPGATVAGIARKVERDKSYVYKLFGRFGIVMMTSGRERSLAALRQAGGYKASPERIRKARQEASDPNNTIAAICRKVGIAPITFREWRKKYRIRVNRKLKAGS